MVEDPDPLPEEFDFVPEVALVAPVCVPVDEGELAVEIVLTVSRLNSTVVEVIKSAATMIFDSPSRYESM